MDETEILDDDQIQKRIGRLKEMYGEAESLFKNPYKTMDTDFPIIITGCCTDKMQS